MGTDHRAGFLPTQAVNCESGVKPTIELGTKTGRYAEAGALNTKIT
jgi:hypothetical protein